MELILIRHGQSYNNALLEDFIHRVEDPPLTGIGEAQAHHLARHIAEGCNPDAQVGLPTGPGQRNGGYAYGITHLYSSAMMRALQTAAPLSAALEIPVAVWLEVHEVGGIWLEKDGVTTGYGGLTRTDLLSAFPSTIVPDNVTESGWWDPALGREDLVGCRARAMRVAYKLRQRAKNEDTANDCVAIVTHGAFLDALLKALLNLLPGDDAFMMHYNTAITRVDFRPDGALLLRCVNRTDHLPYDHLTI
jgi:2,3-bisphosphoglycerate-dependent phosphoglycerate mutase